MIVFIFFVSKSSRVNYNNVISLDSLVNSGFKLYPLDIPLGFLFMLCFTEGSSFCQVKLLCSGGYLLCS